MRENAASLTITVPTWVLLEDRRPFTGEFRRWDSPTRRVLGASPCPRNSMPMAPLNLGRLQEWIDAGRIDTSRVITMKDLLDSRAVHQIKFGVKLLADVGERC